MPIKNQLITASDLDEYLSKEGGNITGNLSVSGIITGSLSGNATSATKLATSRTIRTNLASTSTASFDGTNNITPGVTGVLPVANGGTGNTTGSATKATQDGSGNIITSTYATKSELTELEDKVDSLTDIPIGSIIWFAGKTAPSGFLICNGGTISRITYSALFNIIGTTYGSGDGSTTFGLPNLLNRVVWGSTNPGDYLEAGLPDIIGDVKLSNSSVGVSARTYTGAFYASGNYSRGYNASTGLEAQTNLSFKASLSNSIYGNSSTVQPPSLTLVPYIKAFNTVLNESLIDVTNLANDIVILDAERIKQIGQIHIFATNNLPDGWVICDGSLILFKDYPEFYQLYLEGKFNGMMNSVSNLVDVLAPDRPADITSVGKFTLYNTTGVYLPDLDGLFLQSGTSSTSGNYIEAGLPNITGSLGGTRVDDNIFTTSGAFYRGQIQSIVSGTGTILTNMLFDASRSSSIYGNSSTVQPPSVKYIFAMYLGKSI